MDRGGECGRAVPKGNGGRRVKRLRFGGAGLNPNALDENQKWFLSLFNLADRDPFVYDGYFYVPDGAGRSIAWLGVWRMQQAGLLRFRETISGSYWHLTGKGRKAAEALRAGPPRQRFRD